MGMHIPHQGQQYPRFGRRLGLVLKCLLVILLVGYLFVSSSDFLPVLENVDSNSSAQNSTRDRATSHIYRPIIETVPLQIVAVWTGNSSSQFLPQFFRSLGQNTGTARLLFVNRDTGTGCADTSLLLAANVQSICLKNAEYYDKITKVLCDRWNCTETDRQRVFEYLEQRQDHKNAEWKPLYGQIFHDYLYPHKYVAWSDIDTMYGNLSMLPKYALDGTFDLFTMDHGRDDVNNIYMRGQFTALKRSEKNDAFWLTVPELANPEAFLNQFPRGSLDERFWSLRYMSDKDMDWLQLADGLGGDGTLGRGEKTVQYGLDILQLPVEMTRQETLSAMNDIADDLYPFEFSPEHNEVVKIVTDCPRHWLQDNTTRCVQSAADDGVLYTAKVKDIVTQARAKTTGEFSPMRRFINHFHTIKRRPWFVVPKPLMVGEMFEYSFGHISFWHANSLKHTHCVAFRNQAVACPSQESITVSSEAIPPL